MDTLGIWREIDRERDRVAGLFAELTPDQLARGSLCDGWTVHAVGAHLTLAHMGLLPALGEIARAGGSFNRMIKLTAVREASTAQAEIAQRLRAMIGSRVTAPFVTPMEPLLDLLVHTQDMARPLGLGVPMPREAAVASAERAYRMAFPFFARRRLKGVRLAAGDAPFEAGSGARVDGSIDDLLLLITGRRTTLPTLTGPGCELLRERALIDA